ncbi:MAG: hypothetical protein D6824_08505, partial [Planctomycetota bacterium]
MLPAAPAKVRRAQRSAPIAHAPQGAVRRTQSMPAVDAAAATTLPADSNQALGLARFAIDFFNGRLGEPDEAVLDRVRL